MISFISVSLWATAITTLAMHSKDRCLRLRIGLLPKVSTFVKTLKMGKVCPATVDYNGFTQRLATQLNDKDILPISLHKLLGKLYPISFILFKIIAIRIKVCEKDLKLLILLHKNIKINGDFSKKCQIVGWKIHKNCSHFPTQLFYLSSTSYYI